MIKMELDTRNFDKAMQEYMTFSKRAPADIVNAKLYYIARNATQTTKHSDKSKIRNELEGPSKIGGPLGAILVNSALGKKGLPGLTGDKMARAVEKLIKKRISSVNFIRSGWKNAIQQIELYLRQKGEFNFVRRNMSLNLQPDKATMSKKVSPKSGQAIVARIERVGRVYGEIQNNIGSDKPGLGQIKVDGLQKAINKEEASTRVYIERKLNEAHSRFNR